MSPTTDGSSLVKQWEEERRSPIVQGQRILRYLYELQQDIPFVHRQIGKAGIVDLDDLQRELEIDTDGYLRGARWAERQEYLAEPSIEQFSVENGGIYITDEGMNAVDNEFRTGGKSAGPTINIHKSRVYGDVLAAGRDAMTFGNVNLLENADDIRTLLAQVQETIDELAADDDERHDALQQLESLQRELSKPTPSAERAERSINVIGGIASISAAVGPHLAQLLHILQQLPH